MSKIKGNTAGGAAKDAAPDDKKNKGNANNNSVGGASSKQSSSPSVGDLGRGGGMFQDETKLLGAIKLYSTLDDSGLEALELKNKYDSKQSYTKNTNNNGQKMSNKNIILRIEKKILDKLFQINHIVLSNQGVSVLLFHIIMFLTFIQILFNIFYKVQITNEFSPYLVTTISNNTNYQVTGSIINNSRLLNTSSSQLNSTVPVNNTSSLSFLASMPPRFRVDDYFVWINFQFYVMRQDSASQFYLLYSIVAGVFIAFVVFLIVISGKVFEASKTEDVKEGTKFVLKAVSILMCLYILLLQIPMQTLILQGFLCNEGDSEGEELTIKSIECNTLSHKILTVISTFLLIIFTGFNIVQQVLYTSNSFEIIVPWGSFERTLATFRVIIKLVISVGFIFDKKGAYRGEVNLVLFFLQSFIVIRRYQDCIIFNNSILYATVIYEGISMWLYITVSIHILSNTPLTITSFALLILTGIIFALILVYLQYRQKMNNILVQQNYTHFKQPLDYMIYFFRIYELIESTDPEDQIILEGKLRHHMHYCDLANCPCLKIAESMDETKKYKKIKRIDEEEEQQQIMQQRQMENENQSFAMSMSHEFHDPSGVNNKRASEAISERSNQQQQDLLQNKKSANLSSSNQKYSKHSSIKRVRSNKNVLESLEKGGSRSASKGNDVMAKSWLHQKKKMQKLEEKFSQIFDTIQDQKKIKKQWYLLLSIMISEAIEKYPKHVDLKIINAYIQKSKLNNEFKAIFEMMNCELCTPNIHEQFMIFRKKIEVEQALLKEYQKSSIKPGTLDVVNVFKYERLFQKYQLYEYMTTFAALCFWRELLQKQINAQVLQEKGSQISKYYEIIQDIQRQLMAIYPDEIKLMWRYGNFLIHIIHNEYDASENFRRAVTIFFSRISKKGNGMSANEQTIFGENSASGIIMISATSSRIGTIIHANEEVEAVLGFKRLELIGRNITMIIPRPIAKAHDKLIQRYFETAKPTVIEIKRQLLASNKEGYLREIELIVKVFPQVDDRIVFVGFVQRNDRFDEMEPAKPEFEKYDKQYIITDVDGNITNVTEGLNMELGLHAKFFQYTDSIFQQMFHLQKICPDLFDADLQEQLENEGAIVTLDTRNILNNIELESLTSDEILEVRSNLGQYQSYVQLKRLVIHPQHCTIHIYRVIIISKVNELSNSQNKAQNLESTNQFEIVQNQDNSDFDDLGSHQSLGSAAMLSGQQSMSSMSSTQSGSVSFNRFIKDFKKALGERKTPRNLLYLNRIMKLILVITIALSGTDFAIHRQQLQQLTSENKHNLYSEQRTLKMVQLASNVRSFLNVANGLEFDRYDEIQISPIDRYEYLSRLIQQQASDLQNIHQFMTTKRVDSDAGTDKLQNQFEYEQINLFRLDDSNYVSNYTQPYRVALLSYLNFILQLNTTDRSLIQIPQNLIIEAPKVKVGQIMKTVETTQTQKAAYFLLVNGLRDLRTKTSNATLYQQQTATENVQQTPFLAIMIAGTIVSLLSIILLLQQIYVIELNKAEILSLYALLSITEIQNVYNECDTYMFILDEGSILKAVGSQNNSEQLLDEIGGATTDLITGVGQHFGSNISEDDRDAEIQRQLIEKKKGKGKKGSAGSKRIGSMYAGQDIYLAMIKKTQNSMKDMTMTKEEKANRANGAFGLKSQVSTMKQKQTNKIQNAGKNKDANIKRQPSQQNMKGNTKIKGTKKRSRKLKEDTDDIFESDEKKNNHKRHSREEMKHEGNEISSGESGSNSEEDVQEKKNRKRKEREEKKIEEQKRIQGVLDMSNDEVEERKKQFYRTIKSKNWGKIFTSSIVGVIFTAYFVQLYIYNSFYGNQLEMFTSLIPVFFNRYRYSILGYTFIRERIINNNSLTSFEYDSQYGYNLDSLYIDNSMKIEKILTDLRLDTSSISSGLVDLISIIDSEAFCSQIIGDKIKDSTGNNSTFVEPKYTPTGVKPYQTQVNTIVRAQRAAEAGNVAQIRQLKDQGMDINQVNYDRRNLIHFAAKNGQLECVKYLISQGVPINQQDRWQATPLNYAQAFPIVSSFLKSAGAQMGPNQDDFRLLSSVYQQQNVTDDDFRAFYAAYFGDIQAFQELRSQGTLRVQAVDRDGRSPLSIAASEGNLEVVKYLIRYKANLSIRDSRNNDALADARREKRISVVEFLEKIISDLVIQEHCSDFGEGLFRKGVQQAIGNFHKRFADLDIKVSTTNKYGQLLSLLGAPSTSKFNVSTGREAFNVTSFQTFFSAQELYFNKAIERGIEVIKKTYEESTKNFDTHVEIIFLVFLFFQLVMVFIMRSKLIETMKEDIFQSRGILNLIPDNFFEQNRQRVEKLIKKLKD